MATTAVCKAKRETSGGSIKDARAIDTKERPFKMWI